jgi:hypothetical protein
MNGYHTTPFDEAVALALKTYPTPWTLRDVAGYAEITAANGEEVIGLNFDSDGGPDRFYALQMIVAAVNTAYGPIETKGFEP